MLEIFGEIRYYKPVLMRIGFIQQMMELQQCLQCAGHNFR